MRHISSSNKMTWISSKPCGRCQEVKYDRAGYIGVLGHDPPHIRVKHPTCLPRAEQGPVPETSMSEA